MSEEGKSLPPGTRVSINGKPELGLGTVKYCGMTKFSPGRWVGVELDNAVGKNDGIVQGEKYFDCKPAHGLFVKPNMAVIVEEQQTNIDDGVDDSKLMPAPITTPSKLAAPSGIRPPSSTGIRPPSSLGKGRPSLTGSTSSSNTSSTTSTTTPTSSIKKPTETGIRRPSTIPSTTSSTTTSTTSPTSTSPLTSPPPEKKAEPLPTPTSTSTPTPTPTPTTTTTTTTTTTISSPTVVVEPPPEQPQPTPSKIARPPSSSSSRPSGIPKPSGLKEPTPNSAPVSTPAPAPTLASVPIPTPSTPSPPTTTATTSTLTPTSVQKKQSKIIQGEDEEEEEEINDLLNKSLATEKMNQAVQENIDKMMTTINELKEDKIRSQEEINLLKDRLKETVANKDKQIKENEKQIQQLEKTIATKEKENENILKTQHRNEDKEKSEFEKEKQSLVDQISNLNENLELLTLDKEVTEEKLEMTELEFEQVKEELEMMRIEFDSLKIQLDEKPTRSIDENLPTDVLVLQEQNDKLKEALVKLRDITMNDKHELSKKSKELETLSKQVQSLTEKSNKLDMELSTKIEETLELKLALEDAEDSESLITDLTDKNLSLSEELEELKVSIADLESFRDLSEELSENQAALEKSLRLEVNSKDIEILNIQSQMTNLQIKNQENEKTILQFRDLVGRLQHKLEDMRRKEEEQSEHQHSWSAIQQQLLSKNIQLQNQMIKATALEIDHQLEQSKSVEAQVHLAFVYEYLPEQTFQMDNDAIKMLLLLKRIILKSELSQKYLNRTYKVEEIGNKVAGDSDQMLTSGQVAHSLSIIHILEHLAISTTWLTETLERSSSDQWLRSGRSIKDMLNQERILDNLLQLIKLEQFGPSYSGADLDKLCQRIDSILTNIFGSGPSIDGSGSSAIDNQIFKPEWSTLLNYILGIQYNIKQIMLNDIDITTSITHNEQLIFPHKEMSKVLSVCRKVVKNLLTKPYLSQSSIVRDLLKTSEHTCKSILLELIHSLPKIQEESMNSGVSGSNSNQHLNDLLIKIQARSDLIIANNTRKSNNDEISEFNDDIQDQEESKLSSSLEKVFYRMNVQLSDVVETIIAGDLNLSEKEKQALTKQSPWAERANQLKQSLGEVGQLRDIIQSKDAELLDNLKAIKAKEAELIEEKRKEESFDKRIRILQKSENEVTEKLAKEIKSREDNEKNFRQALNQLRNEKNSLEHDSKNMQHKIITLQQELQKKLNTPLSPMIANQEMLRSVDDINVLSLKKAIRFLRNENLKLKSQKSIKELYELNLIQNYRHQQQLQQKSNNSTSSPSTPSTPTLLEQQIKKQQIKFNEIVEYSKQVNHMMNSILESTATPKVLDLNNSKSSSSSSSSSTSSSTPSSSNDRISANEIEKQKLLIKQQERKVKQLQSKMTNFISSSTSQFGLNNYADANQSRMLKESIPLKIANITIPNLNIINNNNNNNSTNSLMLDKDIQEALNSKTLPIQLFTNPQTFKEIHQVFVK
ncbi:hypothetical protein RB653_005614 [Dictyostelium firmibasis]|uniref:CAP-Gly domain-containing protein n=1 Tax=Dictyostelium firmibasis TaxID=79012 RepID=A0AAN7U7Y7_9MYCE